MQIKFSRIVLISAVVHLGINQCQRNFGHARRLAIARPGKDNVLHARPAQRFGRLFAEHPRNGVSNIRLSAPVRTDDGRNAIAVKLKLGAVAKRLKSEDLELLQFEQLALLVDSDSSAFEMHRLPEGTMPMLPSAHLGCGIASAKSLVLSTCTCRGQPS